MNERDYDVHMQKKSKASDNEATRKFRTRWRRWLGNKTRQHRPYWVTLLDSNWSAWPEQVYAHCGLDYSLLGLITDRMRVKKMWLIAINHADMTLLRKLDAIFATERANRFR